MQRMLTIQGVFGKINIVHNKIHMSAMNNIRRQVHISIQKHSSCDSIRQLCLNSKQSFIPTVTPKLCNIFLLLLIACFMASPTASYCGISLVCLSAFAFLLLTCLSDSHEDTVLCAKLVACLFTCADF